MITPDFKDNEGIFKPNQIPHAKKIWSELSESDKKLDDINERILHAVKILENLSVSTRKHADIYKLLAARISKENPKSEEAVKPNKKSYKDLIKAILPREKGSLFDSEKLEKAGKINLLNKETWDAADEIWHKLDDETKKSPHVYPFIYEAIKGPHFLIIKMRQKK